MTKPPVFRAIVSRLDSTPLTHSRYGRDPMYNPTHGKQDVPFRKHFNKLFKVKR